MSELLRFFFSLKMSKAIRAVEAEIANKIAENRSNCDFICHALLDLGLDEELVGFEERCSNRVHVFGFVVVFRCCSCGCCCCC